MAVCCRNRRDCLCDDFAVLLNHPYWKFNERRSINKELNDKQIAAVFFQKLRNDEIDTRLNNRYTLMKKIALSILFLLFIQMANSQCAMCKAVVESGNPSEAEGLNSGILYLMTIPYLLVGTLFFFIIRSKIRKTKIDEN